MHVCILFFFIDCETYLLIGGNVEYCACNTIHTPSFLTVCRITLDPSKSQHGLLEKAVYVIPKATDSLTENIMLIYFILKAKSVKTVEY